MTRPVRVKICGLSDRETINAAVAAGAAYVGFVCFPKSPRAVTPEQARELGANLPEGVVRVGLTVDMGDAEIETLTQAAPLDMLQLHGNESPERVDDIRRRFSLPVMKAVGIRDGADLPRIADYEAVADQILVDAKPPEGADLPGGNGLNFDWRLIASRPWTKPWMLAGGLTPRNAAEALRLTGATQLDVSSGVESAPGHKDPHLISAFLAAVRDARPLDLAAREG